MMGKVQKELGKEDAKTYNQARYFASKLTKIESIGKLEGTLLVRAAEILSKEGTQ